MPSERRVNDVVQLSAILLSEYGDGRALYEMANRTSRPTRSGVDEDPIFIIELEAGGHDLDGLLATFEAVQMAVDAAAVAVLYDQEMPGHLGQDLNYDFLTKLANERTVSLEILELYAGTFGGKFKAIFKNPVSRATTTAIATVSLTALHIIFPPIVIPTLVFAAGGGLVNIGAAIQDKRAEDAKRINENDRRRQEEAAEAQRESVKQEEAQRNEERQRQQDEEFRSEINRLNREFERLSAEIVDINAARSAEILRVKFSDEPKRSAA